MNEGAWALLGAIVGGLIAGGVTLIAAGMQQHGQRVQWRRQQRFAAYSRYVDAWWRSTSALTPYLQSDRTGPEPEALVEDLKHAAVEIDMLGSPAKKRANFALTTLSSAYLYDGPISEDELGPRLADVFADFIEAAAYDQAPPPWHQRWFRARPTWEADATWAAPPDEPNGAGVTSTRSSS